MFIALQRWHRMLNTPESAFASILNNSREQLQQRISVCGIM
jgi:hypothetical protein